MASRLRASCKQINSPAYSTTYSPRVKFLSAIIPRPLFGNTAIYRNKPKYKHTNKYYFYIYITFNQSSF